MLGQNLQVLIVGTDYEPNFGDQAIFATMVRNLRENIPNVRLTVHSQNPTGTRKLVGKYLFNTEPIKKAVIGGTSVSFNKDDFSVTNVLEEFDNQVSIISRTTDVADILNSHAVILVGGGSKIAEGEKHAIFNLFYLALAKKWQKPVILYFQSVGPFRTTKFKLLVKHVLGHSDLILLRERFSKKLLQSLGVKKKILVSAPDSAFCLKSQKNISVIMEKENLKEADKPLIGICAGSRSTDQQVNDRYCRVIAAVADHLITKLGAKIIFIHTRGKMSACYPDDKETSRRIAFFMRFKDLEIIEEDYDCEILSGIIARFDLLISYRMHALIFALSNGVPIIPISMYYKTKGTLLWAKYPVKDISIGKVTKRKLIRLTTAVFKKRHNLNERILSRLPFLENEVVEKSKLIRKVVFAANHENLDLNS